MYLGRVITLQFKKRRVRDRFVSAFLKTFPEDAPSEVSKRRIVIFDQVPPEQQRFIEGFVSGFKSTPLVVKTGPRSSL